jgi:hypothetical protein
VHLYNRYENGARIVLGLTKARAVAGLTLRIFVSSPSDSESQRDHVTSLTRIGDLLITMGRDREALASYRSALP